MTGRSLQASSEGIEKAKRALNYNNLTQKALAKERGIASWSTVSKFFNGKPVDRSIFMEICDELGLDCQEIAARAPSESKPVAVEGTASNNPDFVGREEAIADSLVFPVSASKLYTQSWKCVDTLTQHRSAVISVAISPDGQTLASGSGVNDQSVKIWSLNTRKPLRTLPGHSSGVMFVAFCPDEHALVSVGSDKTIKIWNLDTGRLLRTFTDTQDSSLFWSVTTSHDGQILAIANDAGRIKLWNLEAGEVFHTIVNEERYSDGFSLEQNVFSVAISPKGQIIAGGTDDGKVKGWYLDDGELFCTINNAHSESVDTIAFSTDGNIVATSDRQEGIIRVWHLITAELLHTLTGHTSSVNAVAFSPDGQILASASGDQTIKLWNLKTGELIQTLCGHTGSILSLTFSPDGQTLVSGSLDNSIKIWRCD
jgi:WD40 repeat protein